MQIKPRDYQSNCIDGIFAEWQKHRSTLVSMFTGGGKTIVFAEVIRRCHPARAIVLAHREELISQAKDKIERTTGLACAVEMADQTAETSLFSRKPVIISTIQTQVAKNGERKRMNRFDPMEFGLLVVDECVSGDTSIALADGSQQSIRQIAAAGISKFVLSVNVQTGAVEAKPIRGIKVPVLRKLWRVVLENGSMLRCTEDHLVFTTRGYMKVKDLTLADSVILLSHDDQHSGSANLRKFDGGCPHAYIRAESVPEIHRKAQHQTISTGGCEIQSARTPDRHAAAQATEWGLGWFHLCVQHPQSAGFRGGVQLMFSEREENGFTEVVERFGRGRIGLVVHGRRITSKGGRAHFDGRFFDFRTRTNGRMAAAAVGHKGKDLSNKGEILFEFEQRERKRIFGSRSPIRDTKYEIQALLAGIARLLELQKSISSETARANFLLQPDMSSPVALCLCGCELPEKQNCDSRKTPPGDNARTNGQIMPDLRTAIPCGRIHQGSLWASAMQAGESKENWQGVLLGESATLHRTSKVASVVTTEVTDFVYDIEVADNHNYFANGVLVHNCHHSTAKSYREVIDYYSQNPNLKILGVTATPDRTDKEALGQVFESVAFDYGILDGVEHGWLCDITQQFVPVAGLDYSHIKTVAGDLKQSELQAVLEAEETIAGMAHPSLEVVFGLAPGTLSSIPVPDWAAYLKGLGREARRAIVFTASVAQAEAFCNIFNRVWPGIADWVCGETNKQKRRDMVRAFADGRVRAVMNCGCLTEGFDDPGVEVIIMARPTKSRSLYAQMVGRATRALPGVVDGPPTAKERQAAIAASQKPYCRIIDYVGNSGKHKLITAFDILGGKVSERVQDMAHQKTLEDGKPVRVCRQLNAAEAELEKKLAEAAEKRRLQEEARKRHLVARSRFSVHEVNPFDHSSGSSKPGKFRAPKGPPPTEKQSSVLRRAGFPPHRVSRKQAGVIIGQLVGNHWKLTDKLKQWRDGLLKSA